MATFAGNPAATALTGTEIVPLTQGGVDKRTTTQDIADLVGVSGDIIGGTGIDVEVDSNGDTVISLAGSGGAVTSVNGDTGVVIVLVPIQIACSDQTTNLTTGTAKATFRMPFAMTLLAGNAGIRASLITAQAAGSIFTVDVNENGSSILSTKLTIDNGEKTSVTAATPPVLSDTSLADDAEITIDIDQVGTPLAKGLTVTLIGYPT